MDRNEADAVLKERAESAAIGAALVGGFAALLVIVSKWARWRGKRNYKKRVPEPKYSLSVKRGLFGHRSRIKLESSGT